MISRTSRRAKDAAVEGGIAIACKKRFRTLRRQQLANKNSKNLLIILI